MHQGSVFCTKRSREEPHPSHVVKLVKDDALAEPAVYDRLLDDLSNPRNHTLPCEIIHSDPSVIIMPFVPNMFDMIWFYKWTYHYMYEILEVRFSPNSLSSNGLLWLLTNTQGMEYLHDRHVAHMVPTLVRFRSLLTNLPTGDRTFTRKTC